MASLKDRFRGCLLGGAVGDSLGALIEFWSWPEIQAQFGPNGIQELAPAYGRLGAITDDTQMTLFTVEGLLRWQVNAESDATLNPFKLMRGAYERWRATQGPVSPPPPGSSWLMEIPEMHALRAPGMTCLTALKQPPHGDRYATINNSKGCGGVMRVAPIGLVLEDPFDFACGAAAITHGHPLGYEASGVMALLIADIIATESLPEAARRTLERRQEFPETARSLDLAVEVATSDLPGYEAVVRLGRGAIAEESLAIGLLCALRAQTFEDGVRMAVNHGGDSDSTGSIAGQILGAHLGEPAIPSRWLEPLELRETIEQNADDLYAWHHERSRRSPEEWRERYPAL